jgi:hypothetical protein
MPITGPVQLEDDASVRDAGDSAGRADYPASNGIQSPHSGLRPSL